MNSPNIFPSIESLIPHRGTMLLLDRVIDFAPGLAETEYSPRRDAWYADDAGDMPAWIGIELMAQTIAAQVALTKRQQGSPPKPGVLLGTRSFASTVASFSGGQALRIRAVQLLQDPGGLGAYECTIQQQGSTLASATLKVYEPDDFEHFIQGSLT